MITTHALNAKKPIAKNNKTRGKAKGTIFDTNLQSTETTNATTKNNDVTDISQASFLQELDPHSVENQSAEKFSQKAFDALNDLRFALLDGKISPNHLYTLKQSLEKMPLIYTKTLSQIINEIHLRVAVEIAKIEANIDRIANKN